jgi:hypothetical protein
MYYGSQNSRYLITLTIISSIALVLIIAMQLVQTVNAQCLGDLSGIWHGDDSGTYYIQQNGQDIWWVGGTTFNEGTTFVNVFFGHRSGDSIKGEWADVPLGVNKGYGGLTLLCSQNLHNYVLTKTAGTGGFGGTSWEK